LGFSALVYESEAAMNRKPLYLLLGIIFWLGVIVAAAKMMQAIGDQ
jgi:hypothetical protein